MANWKLVRTIGIVSALGAAGGALVGAAAFAVVALVVGGMEARVAAMDLVRLVGVGTALGAVAGGLLGPLAGFGFLRSVPLGRAIVSVGLGALAGFGVGILTSSSIFATTLGGFALGVLLARRMARPDGAATATGTAWLTGGNAIALPRSAAEPLASSARDSTSARA